MNASSNNNIYSEEEEPRKIAMKSTQRHKKYLEDHVNKEKHLQRMRDYYINHREERLLYCKQRTINIKLRASAAAQTV